MVDVGKDQRVNQVRLANYANELSGKWLEILIESSRQKLVCEKSKFCKILQIKWNFELTVFELSIHNLYEEVVTILKSIQLFKYLRSVRSRVTKFSPSPIFGPLLFNIVSMVMG